MIIKVESSYNNKSFIFSLQGGMARELASDTKISYVGTCYCQGFKLKFTRNLFQIPLNERIPLNGQITKILKSIINSQNKKKEELASYFSKALDKHVENKNNIIQQSFNKIHYRIFLDEFFNTLRHEITNPITGIRLASSFLKDSNNHAVSEIGSDIHEATLKINLQIEKRQSKKTYSAIKIIRKIISKKKSQNPQVKIKENLNRDLEIKHNGEIFEQIILNLLNNALDACKKKSQAEIEVFSKLDENKFQLAIYDNGEDVVDPNKLFEPYHTTKEKGSGLGLYICKKYCKEIDLQISFEKIPRKAFILRET